MTAIVVVDLWIQVEGVRYPPARILGGCNNNGREGGGKPRPYGCFSDPPELGRGGDILPEAAFGQRRYPAWIVVCRQ